MAEFLYVLMLSFFLTHEIDAAFRHEWRVLPITSFLPDEAGRVVFIGAHVPLLVSFFWFDGLNHQSALGLLLSAFAIVHVGLHWLYRRHPAYEFNNWLSVALIVGAGAAGVVHMGLVLLGA